MCDLWTSEMTANALAHGDDDAPRGADAFAAGLVEGRRTAEAEFAADRAALAVLIDTIEALQPHDETRLAATMVTAVVRLVREIAGNAPVDAELLNERCVAVAACVGRLMIPILSLHPDDAALIAPDLVGVEIAHDASLSRGSVRVAHDGGLIEDGVAVALDRLDDAATALGIAA